MTNIVTYQRTDLIATITMDDGKVNVMSPAMLSELNKALDRALADKAVVVLIGRTGVFSAGFDLNVLKAGGAEADKMVRAGFELAKRMLSFPTPIVVACTGHALAMGVFLVLSADYRVGAEGEFKLGANEVAIGLTVPQVAIELCRLRLAPAHFNRAVINAEPYAPLGAVEAGFLDRIVPATELMGVALGAASQLAKLHMPSHAATKLRARAQALEAITRALEMEETASLGANG